MIALGQRKYPDTWAALCYKWYKGGMEFKRTVNPKKKPRNGHFSFDEERRNSLIASDRIIAANYFGIMCGFSNIMSSKYRWGSFFYFLI